MRIVSDWGKVRIVHEGSPLEVAYDIRVEWLVEGEWQLYHGFNSFSDDYAYTNSKEAAGRAIKRLAEESAKIFG